VDALARLRSLALEFRQAARSGDPEGMGEILAERQSVLGALATPDGPDPERARALQEILDLDRESEAILERRRAEIRDELTALGQGRRGLHGYGRDAARASNWIDERG
jgi:hypothetical protein